MSYQETWCRCGHELNDHGSRIEQRDGEKVYVQPCKHCSCEVFVDRDGCLSRMLDEFRAATKTTGGLND